MRPRLPRADPGRRVPSIRENDSALEWELSCGHGGAMSVWTTLLKVKNRCESCPFGSHLLQMKVRNWKYIWMPSLLRYHVLKVHSNWKVIGSLFLYPKENFTSALEGRGCFFLKRKTDMLIVAKIVSVPSILYFNYFQLEMKDLNFRIDELRSVTSVKLHFVLPTRQETACLELKVS